MQGCERTVIQHVGPGKGCSLPTVDGVCGDGRLIEVKQTGDNTQYGMGHLAIRATFLAAKHFLHLVRELGVCLQQQIKRQRILTEEDRCDVDIGREATTSLFHSEA